jgi:hypothetical protein
MSRAKPVAAVYGRQSRRTTPPLATSRLSAGSSCHASRQPRTGRGSSRLAASQKARSWTLSCTRDAGTRSALATAACARTPGSRGRRGHRAAGRGRVRAAEPLPPSPAPYLGCGGDGEGHTRVAATLVVGLPHRVEGWVLGARVEDRRGCGHDERINGVPRLGSTAPQREHLEGRSEVQGAPWRAPDARSPRRPPSGAAPCAHQSAPVAQARLGELLKAALKLMLVR